VRVGAGPPNKGMKQTSVEHIGRSQLIPGVRLAVERKEVDETRATLGGGRHIRVVAVNAPSCSVEQRWSGSRGTKRNDRFAPRLWAGKGSHGRLVSRGGSRGAVARPPRPVRTRGAWRNRTRG
jgi:hypothetical protein